MFMKYDRGYYLRLIDKYNDAGFFKEDPIAVVRMLYDKKTDVRDIEILGVVASWVSFGNRKQIFKKCGELYRLMDGSPYRYLLSQQWRCFENCSKDNLYRMFVFSDFYALMNSLYSVYSKYDSLQDAVFENSAGTEDYLSAIIKLLPVKGIPKDTSSACKRLCLFLRWMVRTDGKVDLGVWKRLSPEKLIIPLDVHVHNIAKLLDFTGRKQPDMKTALEITDECRLMFPSDPVVMDYALFGVGYDEKI